MSAESYDHDRGLTPRLELEGTSKEEVRRPLKTVYTREFLLSCAELDVCKQLPRGFDPSVFGQSKTVYTREFLLSCAGLDGCKQLPKGFDPSILHEPEDTFKGILEPQKGSGVLFFPNSGNSRCRVQFTGLDSRSSSWGLVGRSDSLSFRWNKESNSQGNYHSDFKRHDDPTRCLVKVSGYKAEDVGKRTQETEKNEFYQLSRSENPYRPPHTFQVGSTKYEGKPLSSKSISIEKMDCDIQEETQLQGHRITEDEQNETKDTTFLAEDNSSSAVYFAKPSCHDFNFLEPNVTSEDDIIHLDSKKANKSPIREELNEEQSRIILEEDVGSFLKVPNGCSSTIIEKALPQLLAANSEFEMGYSSDTCFPGIVVSRSVLKNSNEGNTGYFQVNQSPKPISEMELNKLLSTREFYSGQRGPFNRTTRNEVSEPYEFPFTIAYDLFSSVLCEYDPIRTNHQKIIIADAADKIDLYDCEEIECTFDDMWSEILAIVQFEQEMELTAAAQSDETTDFEVQLPLPDEDSLIPIDNPTSSEHSIFVPLNSSSDVADYDTEIHLPDENGYISMDDLIAPENKLISIGYPISTELPKFVPLNSSRGAADDDAEIHLPDENSLITIDDLIAPNHLKFIDSGSPVIDDTSMSIVRDEVARQREAPVITDHAKESATQSLEVPPSHHMAASRTHLDLHFCQSSLHIPCTAINPERPVCYPFNSLEAQMRIQTTNRVPNRYYPAAQLYCCPNMVHQFPWKAATSKSKEFSSPVQYSLLQKPSSFPRQSHLPIKYVASYNWELEKMQLSPVRYQQTAYPDSAIAHSGSDHQL